MKFLPDTQLPMWWLSNSPLLPAQARELIADPNNTIFVSAVSHWEVWLKSSIGKLRVPSGFSQKLGGAIRRIAPEGRTHGLCSDTGV